jgi:hypothetical protein
MFFETRNRLLALKHECGNREFTAGTFTKIIRKQFSAKDYIFRTEKSYAVDLNSIISGGLYDSENDIQGEPHTEIILYYHPEQMTFKSTDLDWDFLSFNIAECIAHEQIHRDQFHNNTKLFEYNSNIVDESKRIDQNYLGHDEEIEAYGFSIAAESAVFDRHYSMTNMYFVYRNTFDTDHSVVVKLEKQIVKYLEQLKLEPYNEQDHSGNQRSNSGRHVRN